MRTRKGIKVKVGQTVYNSIKQAERKLGLSRGSLLQKYHNRELVNGYPIELLETSPNKPHVFTVKLTQEQHEFFENISELLGTTKSNIWDMIYNHGKPLVEQEISEKSENKAKVS